MRFQQDERRHHEEALKIDRQRAKRNPAVYLPDMAMTLSDLVRVDQLQNRIEKSRAHFEEALNLLRKLSQGDNRYASELPESKPAWKNWMRKPPPIGGRNERRHGPVSLRPWNVRRRPSTPTTALESCSWRFIRAFKIWSLMSASTAPMPKRRRNGGRSARIGRTAPEPARHIPAGYKHRILKFVLSLLWIF
jgi:hypothetical protein